MFRLEYVSYEKGKKIKMNTFLHSLGTLKAKRRLQMRQVGYKKFWPTKHVTGFHYMINVAKQVSMDTRRQAHWHQPAARPQERCSIGGKHRSNTHQSPDQGGRGIVSGCECFVFKLILETLGISRQLCPLTSSYHYGFGVLNINTELAYYQLTIWCTYTAKEGDRGWRDDKSC